MQTRQWLVSVKLRGQAIRSGAKVFEVLRRPPIEQPALCVELAALIVEAVTDLVTNDRADAAVVFELVSVRIEEGRIQHRGRKIQTVLDGQIQRIHRLRG